MTLDQLRIFVAVAECEHVTRGAREANVTQSGASAAIAALEERHGVKLFDRTGRGVTLTQAGQLFLAEARDTLERAARAKRVLGELGELKRGVLRMAASQTVAAYWLPPFLSRFHSRYPLIGIELAVANTEQTASQVREGSVDLGIVEGSIDDPILSLRQLGADRLKLVSSRPFKGENIDRHWLAQVPWIMREHGSGTRSALDEALRQMDVDPAKLDIQLMLPTNEGVRTIVEAGLGVAALSSLVVNHAVASGDLHELPLDLGFRPFFGLQHRERRPSKAVDAFLQIIEASHSPVDRPASA